MLNKTLYLREMKRSVRLLVIFAAVITLYVSTIISMYDPALMGMLDGFVRVLPQLMAAVGMTAGATTLLGFMVSYLYGFILLIFPMLYAILRANALVAKYVDSGAMITLVAAPVKRRSIALTQLSVLLSGMMLLLAYVTALEYAAASLSFPGQLRLSELLRLNAGLLCLHLFIAGVCFFFSCLCSDTKYSLAFGAGIPVMMYILRMLANMGEKASVFEKLTFFTLFDAGGLAAGESGAILGAGLLLIGALALDAGALLVFSRKDLHI